MLYHLSILFAVALLLTQTHAQEQACTNTHLAVQTAKSNNITRGALSTFTDNDRSFAYSPNSCTSTDQRIIPIDWTLACQPSIEAVCDQIPSPTNAATTPSTYNKWLWSWFSDGGGNVCQAGIYRPSSPSPSPPPDNNDNNTLSAQCCRSNFLNMLNAVTSAVLTTPLGGGGEELDLRPNRVSVNIAAEGYPETRGSDSDGGTLQVEFTGEAVDAGEPSYILQG
ncbi:MAG: hypothetical protein LQ350_006666 [Teloschistes chrysophthalmus]|nr:MAG: hypothetical protein LQ350_006666 [Niorma chrysophthalma]